MKKDLKSRPIKIKVCGMLDPANLAEVCLLSPDFVGYIFYPGSKRYVGNHPDPALFRIPGEGTAKVGVFVDEELSGVARRFEQCQLDLVQLHGTESPGYCRDLVEEGIPVIKVFHPENPLREKGRGTEGLDMKDYAEAVHYFLFDSGRSGEGGSGHQLDWELLRSCDIPLPFLLGGGIGPDDAGRLKALDLENLFGVDVNSRFESSPGIKDAGLLSRFIEEIRNHSIKRPRL
jgi:phosphoribosylanthranilate isomerase